KVAPSDKSVASAAEQSVDKATPISSGDNIALNVRPADVASYSREGSALVVHLRSGEVLRVSRFFANPNLASHLYLVTNNQLVLANLSPAAGTTLTATYTTEAIGAGFSALP